MAGFRNPECFSEFRNEDSKPDADMCTYVTLFKGMERVRYVIKNIRILVRFS